MEENTTILEVFFKAFCSCVNERQVEGGRFYKLDNGILSALEENDLPDEYFYRGDDEYDEYGDCAYCPVRPINGNRC